MDWSFKAQIPIFLLSNAVDTKLLYAITTVLEIVQNKVCFLLKKKDNFQLSNTIIHINKIIELAVEPLKFSA